MAASPNGLASRYDFNALVQAEQGLISRRIFVEEDVYQLELAKIFAKCWLFLCHESQIPNPGDFFSSYMGEDPILVTRGKDGKVRAFLNSCRHRGMRVCRADAGNAAAFTCAYHAWTYASDGRLIGVPNHHDAYYAELDKAQWGLVPVPRLESYAGLIFGTWDVWRPCRWRNTSATSPTTSTSASTAGRAVSSSCPARTSGRCPATGSSPQTTLWATCITRPSATVRR